ncbi:hypothetical protein ACOMHN_050120 [Nucella lapillus]
MLSVALPFVALIVVIICTIAIVHRLKVTANWRRKTVSNMTAAFQLARLHCRQASSVRKKLDVKKLKEPQVQQALKDDLTDSLLPVPQADDDIEAAWSSFRDAVYNSAKSVLGHPRKKHQDWFDESNKEIWTSLQKRE